MQPFLRGRNVNFEVAKRPLGYIGLLEDPSGLPKLIVSQKLSSNFSQELSPECISLVPPHIELNIGATFGPNSDSDVPDYRGFTNAPVAEDAKRKGRSSRQQGVSGRNRVVRMAERI